MADEMKVLVMGRGAGKTHTLIEWVKQGVETKSYPGWSRVILTHSLDEAERLRRGHGLDYRQVFEVGEWVRARLGRKPVEVAVDNADLVLSALLRQRPEVIALTGVNWMGGVDADPAE